MHLDAKDLTFIDEQDGGHAISMELAAVTTNIDGQIQDSKIGAFDGYIRNEDLDQFRKEGINFNLYLPVKRPGAYYVRVALKDKASGKIGTAYQFLEIPDLKKKRLALSSIFVLNHREDVSEFRSEAVGQRGYGSDSVLERQETRKSPAIRSYLPGERFDYMVVAYNAKEKQAPDLETQFVLFKDDEEFVIGNILPVSTEGIDGFFGIPITRRLLFEETMEPGKYVLQVTVTDNQAKKKNGTASQAIDFEIQKKN